MKQWSVGLSRVEDYADEQQGTEEDHRNEGKVIGFAWWKHTFTEIVRTSGVRIVAGGGLGWVFWVYEVQVVGSLHTRVDLGGKGSKPYRGGRG